MGGRGSGSWQTGKFTTDDFPREDVLRVWRYYELTPIDNGITLTADVAPVGMRPLYIETRVSLVWTRCNYGGFRPWFVCPLCGRRGRFLYAQPTYACRSCRGLTYMSTREDETERSIRKAKKVLRRLGAVSDGIWDRCGKPAGMHWTTYESLIERARDGFAKALPGLREQKAAGLRRLARIQALQAKIDRSVR